MDKAIKVQSPLAPLDKGGISFYSPFIKGRIEGIGSEASGGFDEKISQARPLILTRLVSPATTTQSPLAPLDKGGILLSKGGI